MAPPDSELERQHRPTSDAGWQTARAKLRQLEDMAHKMSPAWFAGNAGVITAAGLFILTALILGGTLERILQYSATAQQIQGAIAESVSLQESLDEAAAAGRGFLLTRDRSLLDVRSRALLSARASFKRLSVQLKDDDAAKGELHGLETSIASRVRLFNLIVSVPDGPAVRTEEVQRLHFVRVSNAQLSQLRGRLLTVLRAQEAGVNSNLQLAIGLVLTAGIAAPLCGLVGIYLLRRERDSQRANELQIELMHVQRLAIMGETSAMLAHEINQPLTAATNYLSVLRRHLEAGATDKAEAMVERISQQIQRAGSILRKLRRFIEKRESERTIESPEILIDDAITLLGTIDSTVALDTRIGPSLPHVMVDRVQLQQVLVNLMRNAIEAMQDSPRRELVLSVFSPDGKIVEIALADTGPGLPPDVAERLFQPFVSTKQGGMGVGLSISRSIIAQHNGRIWAEPNPGGGTVFRFALPAVEERAAA